MTTRKRTLNAPAPKVEETPAAVEEVVAEAPVTEETPAQEEIAEEAPVEATEPVLKDKDPVVGELKEEEAPSTLKEAQSAESIHDQIRNKLSSRKTDEEDMFNPGVSQAVNRSKMAEVASEKGFELTRGREIGARLIARSKTGYRP